jgi:hypothetical protein
MIRQLLPTFNNAERNQLNLKLIVISQYLAVMAKVLNAIFTDSYQLMHCLKYGFFQIFMMAT